jgi:hypothetical protein
MPDNDRDYARSYAVKQMQEAIATYERVARDLRETFMDFDTRISDAERADVVNNFVRIAAMGPGVNLRVDLLAKAQARLTVQAEVQS